MKHKPTLKEVSDLVIAHINFIFHDNCVSDMESEKDRMGEYLKASYDKDAAQGFAESDLDLHNEQLNKAKHKLESLKHIESSLDPIKLEKLKEKIDLIYGATTNQSSWGHIGHPDIKPGKTFERIVLEYFPELGKDFGELYEYMGIIEELKLMKLKVSPVDGNGNCSISDGGPINLELHFSTNESKMWLKFEQKQDIRILCPNESALREIALTLSKLNSAIRKYQG